MLYLSCRQFGEIYAAMQLAGASRESFRGTACWFLLQQLLLTGDVQRAYLLLTAHLNAQNQPMEQATLDDACEHFVLENLARCVMSMPRYNSESYSSMEQFQSQLSEWMASLEQLEQSLPVRHYLCFTINTDHLPCTQTHAIIYSKNY